MTNYLLNFNRLHLLHEAGFVHGDLRCSNNSVMSGTVRLIDFERAGVTAEAAHLVFMLILLMWYEAAHQART